MPTLQKPTGSPKNLRLHPAHQFAQPRIRLQAVKVRRAAEPQNVQRQPQATPRVEPRILGGRGQSQYPRHRIRRGCGTRPRRLRSRQRRHLQQPRHRRHHPQSRETAVRHRHPPLRASPRRCSPCVHHLLITAAGDRALSRTEPRAGGPRRTLQRPDVRSDPGRENRHPFATKIGTSERPETDRNLAPIPDGGARSFVESRAWDRPGRSRESCTVATGSRLEGASAARHG